MRDLQNNQLTGPIPPELGQLSQLEQLYLGNNQLTGSILSGDGTIWANCWPGCWESGGGRDRGKALAGRCTLNLEVR